MTAATFEAVLKATDHASGPFRAITDRVHAMTTGMHAAERQAEALNRATVFQRMGTGLATIEAGWGRIHDRIGKVHDKMSTLLPVLGGLAAALSVKGIFSQVAGFAEDQAKKTRRLETLGVDPARLGVLTGAMKMVFGETEDLDRALHKLAVTTAEVGRGGAHEAGDLFKHLGVNIRDSKGQLRDATDLMIELSDAFAKTTNSTARDAMAKTLFGKSGFELIAMLRLGRAELEALGKSMRGIGFMATADDKKNAQNYAREMMMLGAAVKGVNEEIAAAVMPALEPLIRAMRIFIVENRNEIKAFVLDVIKKLEAFDWKKFGRDIRDTAFAVRDVVDSMGGFVRIVEVLIGLKLVGWGIALVRSLGSIAVAARGATAALAAMEAAVISAGSAAGFAPLLARLGALANVLTPLAAAIAVMWPKETAQPEQDEARGDTFEPTVPESRALSRMVYQRRGEFGRLGPGWRWDLSGSDEPPGTALPAPSLPFMTLPAQGLPQPPADHPLGYSRLRPDQIVPFAPSPGRLQWNLPSLAALPSLATLPTIGAPRPAEAMPPPPGRVDVNVRFDNAPPGMRVDTRTENLLGGVETNIGFSDPAGFGGY